MRKTRRFLVKIVLGFVGTAILVHYLFLIVVEIPDLKGIITEMNRGAELDFEYINQANKFGLTLQDMDTACRNLSVGLLRSELSGTEIEELVTTYARLTEESDKEGEAVLDLKTRRSEELSTFQYAHSYRPDSN